MAAKKSTAERIEGYTTRDANGCWLWIGPIDTHGYAQLKIAGRMRLIHRFAYESACGPIPTGLTLDHLCRVRGCVNPSHLEPVTMRENVLRGAGPAAVNARRGRCSHGHPLDGKRQDHTRTHTRRFCRTCGRIASAAYYKRRNAHHDA